MFSVCRLPGAETLLAQHRWKQTAETLYSILPRLLFYQPLGRTSEQQGEEPVPRQRGCAVLSRAHSVTRVQNAGWGTCHGVTIHIRSSLREPQ